MKEFFDHFLKGQPMPKWYQDGVQRLDMDDHLRTRAQPAKPPAVQSGQTSDTKERQQ